MSLPSPCPLSPHGATVLSLTPRVPCGPMPPLPGGSTICVPTMPPRVPRVPMPSLPGGSRIYVPTMPPFTPDPPCPLCPRVPTVPPFTPDPPCPHVPARREERESWIRAKYEQRLFLAPLPAAEAPLSERLLGAVRDQDLPAVLLLLAHSTKDQLNVPMAEPERRMALHLACDTAQVVVTQLLVWVRGAGGGVWRVRGRSGVLGWPWGMWGGHRDCGVNIREVTWLWGL